MPTITVARLEECPPIRVEKYHLRVALPGSRTSHLVQNGRCTCGDPNCSAVIWAALYTTQGGELPPEPPAGYWPWLPEKCPVCGSGVKQNADLSNHYRGHGWVCADAGASHYWQYEVNSTRLRSLCLEPRRCECDAYPVPHKMGVGKCTVQMPVLAIPVQLGLNIPVPA